MRHVANTNPSNQTRQTHLLRPTPQPPLNRHPTAGSPFRGNEFSSENRIEMRNCGAKFWNLHWFLKKMQGKLRYFSGGNCESAGRGRACRDRGDGGADSGDTGNQMRILALGARVPV